MNADEIFSIDKNDYEEAGIGDLYPTDFRDNIPLSFGDMDLHELLLLDLKINDQDCINMIFYTDMNERFLHTFIDNI